MALSDADRAWLEGRFDKGDKRIEGLTTEVYNFGLTLQGHVSKRCDEVEKHEEKAFVHNPVKFWSLLSAVVGVISTVVAAIYRFVTNGGGK